MTAPEMPIPYQIQSDKKLIERPCCAYSAAIPICRRDALSEDLDSTYACRKSAARRRIDASRSDRSETEKRNGYRVFLTLHVPMQSVSQGANKASMWVDESFPLMLEAQDRKELSMRPGAALYPFNWLVLDRNTALAHTRHDWPSTCMAESGIYGLEKVAEELTSQAHAQAIKNSAFIRILTGMETRSEGIADASK